MFVSGRCKMLKHSTLGSYIRSLRIENGMTQARLAEKIGVTDKAVSKWERDLSYPDMTLFPRLADILGVTVNDLLNGGIDEGEEPSRLLQIFGMSHDIRTPLHIILSCANLAQIHLEDLERVSRYLDYIRVCGEYLLQTTDRLMEVTDQTSGMQSRPLPDRKAAEENAAGQAGGLKRTGEGQTAFTSGSEETGEGKPGRSETADGGLTGKTGSVETAERDWSGKEDGSEMVDGCQPGKSGRSETADGSRPGTLGRSETADGSQPGKPGGKGSAAGEGSSGTGYAYPSSVEELGAFLNERTFTRTDTLENYDFSGKRILIAEDIRLNQEIAAEILRPSGADVDFADDGQICVDKVEHSPAGYYDMILMDIRMPNMDGLEATRRIRRLKDPKKASIPIVAISADVYEKDREAAFEAGMDAFTEKPVFFDKLFAAMQQVLSKTSP